MPCKSNQEIEDHYFEQFRKVYPLPDGQIKYGDKPDVIIEGTRRVGIEVTTFFREKGDLPESEQNQRKIREGILKEAQRRYLREGRKPIEIWFTFNKEQPIRKRGKIITEIVNLGRRIENFETGRISNNLFTDIPELSFVYLDSNLYSDPKWRILEQGSVEEMAVPRLEEILREKERKAKNYSKCDAYWLLVVVDFINLDMDQEIRIEGVELISNIYEKKIVYKTGFDHVLEF